MEHDLLDTLEELHQPIAGKVPISTVIDPMVREGTLYEALPDKAVHCYACGHHCKINLNKRGICQIRYNLNGKLYVPWGYVAALNCDPTEKKPYYHVHPGSDTMTFGMLGCDLHCSYCQNWDISQTLRDANAGHTPSRVTPGKIVELALKYNAKCVASSYNEPLITSEWAMAIFKLAKAQGLTCLYVSNGNATPEVLRYIRPYTDGFKVDLKTMNDKNYRKLGAVLQNILDSIRTAYEMGFWVEIVTLVVPGFNDSEEELRESARFIKSVSPDIPWHVSAFYPTYKMHDPENTSPLKLMQAAEIGCEEGLHYVYAGNLAGRVNRFENTRCPNCQTTLIKRTGYHLHYCKITKEGTCPNCHTRIAGIWN
jgi:pyruvate formate lyase activating enzyme